MAAVQRGGSSQSVPGASTTKWAARLALVGIVGTVFFVMALTAMHLLRPHDLVRYGTNIGFYSVGPYGSIFVAAFIALGLAGLALALGLRLAVARSRSLRAGSVLIGLFGMGWIVGGIFRDAPDVASLEPVVQGKISSVSMMVHGLGAFGGLFLLMSGMLVLARAFKRDQRWHSFWIPSLILGLATLALFVMAFFIEGPDVVPCCPSGSVAWWGAIEFRFFFGAFVLWLLLASIRLRVVSKRSGQA
jgi:MFS family permease